MVFFGVLDGGCKEIVSIPDHCLPFCSKPGQKLQGLDIFGRFLATRETSFVTFFLTFCAESPF